MNALHFILFPVYAALLYVGWLFAFANVPSNWMSQQIILHGENTAMKILIGIRFLGLVLIALGTGLVWYIS